MSLGGSKKTTTKSDTNTDTSQSTDSLSNTSGSQLSNALNSSSSSGIERALSQLFSSGLTSGTNTGTSSTGFSNTQGGTTANTATRNPFEASLPYIMRAMGGLDSANSGALDRQMAALQGSTDYAKQAFGGASGINLGDSTSALRAIMSGGGIGPIAGSAGSAQGALERMLSGQPDYAGLSGAIDAANAPILRQLEQDIIPGLNSKATFLNNSTGGIKTLNRVMPEIADRMSQNAAQLTNAERVRALNDQQAGLGLFGSLLGQGNSQALQAAGMTPDMLQMGLIPGQYEQQLAGLPQTMAQQYANSMLPFAGIGGTDTAIGTNASTGAGQQMGQTAGTSSQASQ